MKSFSASPEATIRPGGPAYKLGSSDRSIQKTITTRGTVGSAWVDAAIATILIVDSDSTAGHSIEKVVVSCGCTPLLAHTGRLALELARTFRPQLAILAADSMDWRPSHTLRELQGVCPRIEALLTSEAALGDDEVNEALLVGFSGFLRKPIESSAFRSQLRRLNARHPTTPIASLLRNLDDAYRHGGLPDAVRERSIDPLVREIVWTLAAPALTFLEFVAVARTLRLVISACAQSWVIDEVRASLQQGGVCRNGQIDERVSGVISDLQSGVQLHGRSTVPESLAGPIRRSTGHTLPQLRRISLVRQAVRPLALTDEHVRQIAFQLGYQHASECDRDFQYVLKMTPTRYRAVFRDAASAQETTGLLR